VELFAESDRGTGAPRPPAPLADRMRPRALDEIVGQEHLLGPGRVLRAAIETGELHSMILWGPPGTGKTTLAQLIAHVAGARFVTFSAVMSGVKEIRAVTAEAETQRMLHGRRTILFVDEIHRFNKAQQDAFLPHVEAGTIVLIGATTENPSFEVIAPLLSRTRVLVLEPLTDDDVGELVDRALADPERGLGKQGLTLDPTAREFLLERAQGDARIAFGTLEVAARVASTRGTRGGW
jgi:putative ATPase